ncbi:Xaa-Pro aminopeptidase [Aliiglaciecola sp. LCG003]|uniref:Xaa-Pro aminopeptidase n=1 Tax=Aliiglaciecola sp. LCG003 TaxID=3053655 RepID=UPI002572DB5C|nr:Xaa-Pro aminopeptidase [Aliiglaciecola sp. LCG003]WJG10228.1 Xaa-Pro aminopeptidase [Aliiglaciecola sp. LCG003]
MINAYIERCEQRRQALLAAMLPNSVCIVPASTLVTRSNDTEYTFRQDSDFHYLTGFPEPDAVLVMSNSEVWGSPFSALFCLAKDPLAEIWHGRRIGTEHAVDQFGFSQCHNLDDIEVGLTSYIDGHQHLYYARGHQAQTDTLIDDVLAILRDAPKQSKQAPECEIDLRALLHEMRLFKDDDEIALMRQVASISCEAHKQAMLMSEPGKNEFHLEAQLHYSFALHGAKNPAYSTIVGGGDNACILHYTNNDCLLQDGDLVLIDAGAELLGYAADITRTFPVNGHFSTAQKQLYQLVLDAQLASLALFVPGSTFKAATDKAVEVLTQGLLDLGILTGTLQDNIAEQHYRQFFMHGIGHWLGLDVHDVGNYKVANQDRPFEPGMVMTIEPGLYIAADADVDEKWRGIGIRIEDNILITPQGYEVLTAEVPKSISEIEALMAG